MGANDQTTITFQNNCSAGVFEQMIITASAPAIGVTHSSNSAYLRSGGTADFSIVAGSPTASTLTSQTPLSYTVAVVPANSATGTVNLGYGPLPAGVSAQFFPSSVTLTTSGGPQYSTLTFTGSATTPGGTAQVTLTGQLGAVTHTATIALGTLVTTTSYSPTAILNNNAVFPLTITVSPDSPALSGCTTPDPNITCDVSTSSQGSGTASIWVKATTAATHGTRVLSFNGGAVQLHLATFDASPTLSGIRNNLTAGQTTDITVDCACPDPDDGDYNAAPPDVEMTGPAAADWIYLDHFTPNQMLLVASPPPDTTSGSYSGTVDFCVGFLPFGGADECTVDAGTYYVAPPEPPPCVLGISSPANGQIFDTTSPNYNQASVPLNAVSNCSGTANWTFNFSYQLINWPTYTYSSQALGTTQTLNCPVTFATPNGNGGQAAATASTSFASQSLTAYVDGNPVPNSLIVSVLDQMYGGGATPNLLVGIATHETACMQFQLTTNGAYTTRAYWPIETPLSSIPVVGLMQLAQNSSVGVSQSVLFDWTANALGG